MRSRIIHQGQNRTISILYNDQGEEVARLDQPRLVTGEEESTLARKFAKDYPDLFAKDQADKIKRLKQIPGAYEAWVSLFRDKYE